MAKPEIWLPPLNSHPDYSVSVVASQLEESWYCSSISEPKFVINVNVSVTYYPDKSDTDITIKGLSVDQSFMIDCSEMDSDESSREVLTQMFQDSYIPFELNGVLWRERDLEGNVKILSEPVENADCLIDKIAGFANCMRKQAACDDTGNYNALPMELSISKMIVVPDMEIRAWNSWIEEEMEEDPDFEEEYMKAISRPRTREELQEEIDLGRTAFKHWRN